MANASMRRQTVEKLVPVFVAVLGSLNLQAILSVLPRFWRPISQEAAI
jgi:hypothetical protein